MHPVLAVSTRLREQSPLVQCLTNFVSMDLAANLLNAAGASPAMVHDPEESSELAAIASAVCVNIGTPSPRWADGMREAAAAAHDHGIPWVLDPVAVGATRYRRELVASLLASAPTVLRGNAGEILTLAGQAGTSRGVDSIASVDQARPVVQGLARELGCVVVVSGEADIVADAERVALVHGGHPWMPMITALGCSASALVAAATAVIDDPFEAAVGAMGLVASAGAEAAASANGPASLRIALVDRLARVDDDARGEVRVEVLA